MMRQFATLTGNEKFKGMTWGMHVEPEPEPEPQH